MALGSREDLNTPLPAAVGHVRWTVLSYAAGKVITLAASVALARLLVPADFGVVMLAFVAMNVLGVFGDLGVGAAVVLRQDLDRRGLGTALSIVLATGAVLALGLAAVAPVLGRVLDEPRLGGVLAAMAPLTVLGAFTFFHQWLLQRDLAFRSRFFGLLAQAASYAVVAIAAAALGAGVWSIVAGHLAGQLAMTAVFLRVGPRLPPRFDRRIARSLLRSSRGFLLQNSAALAQQNADYLAIGSALGSAPLGLYSMAYRLSELPFLAIADPVTRVTFPTFAGMQARGEEVRDHYLATLRLVALVTVPCGVLLSAAAGPFTRFLYGDRWLPMAAALTALGVWGALKSVQWTVEWFLNSVGGAGAAGGLAIAVLVVQAPLLFVAASWGGIEAVGWALVAGVAVSMVVLVAFLRRRSSVGFGAHATALAPVAVAATAAWGAARAAASVSVRPAVACAASLTAGVAVYLALISALAPGGLGRAARQLRDAVRGSGTPAAFAPRPGGPEGGPSAPGGAAPVGPDRTGAPAATRPPATPPSS